MCIVIVCVFLEVTIIEGVFQIADYTHHVLKKIELQNLSSYSIIYKANSKEGFGHDGTEYVVLKINVIEAKRCIAESQKWKPLGNEYNAIASILYGGEISDVFYSSFIQEIPDEYIPDITAECLYCFIDYQNVCEEYSEENILKLYQRNSVNFTLALINVNEEKLYYISYAS